MIFNLTLIQRITLGFILVACVMGVALWSASNALLVSQQALSKATKIESTKIRDVARMVQNLIALQRSEKNLILSKLPAEMDEYESAIRKEDAELRRLLGNTMELVSEPEAALLDEFIQQYNNFRNTQEKVVAFSRDNSNVKAKALSQGASRDAYDTVSDSLNYIVNLNDLYAQLLNTDLSVNDAITELATSIVQGLLTISLAELNMILSSNKGEIEEYSTLIANTQPEINKFWGKLRRLLDSDNKAIMDGFMVTWSQLLVADRRIQALSKEGGNNKARTLSQGDARIAFDLAVTALSRLSKAVDLTVNNASNLENPSLIIDRVKLSSSLVNDLFKIQRGEKNLILSLSDREMSEYSKIIASAQVDFKRKISEISVQLNSDEKILLDLFVRAYKKYFGLHSEVLRLSRLNSNVKAFNFATNDGRYLADEIEQWLARLIDEMAVRQAQLLVGLAKANEKEKMAEQINYNLTQMQRDEKNIILATRQSQIDVYSSRLLDARTELDNRVQLMTVLFIDEYRSPQHSNKLQKLSYDLNQQRIHGFNTAYKNYLSVHDEIRILSLLNSNIKAFDLSIGLSRTQFEKAQNTLSILVDTVDDEMAINLVIANEKINQARSISYLTFVIAAIISAVVIYFVSRSLIFRTQRLVLRAQLLAAGKISSIDDQYGKYLGQDELSRVDEALDLIDEANQKIVDVSNAMAVGNLSLRLTTRSDDDPLVDAINQMADNSAEVVSIANIIASGDLSIEVVAKSEQDQLAKAIQRMLVNLRSATVAKDQFLTSMSHELRTPLNAIIGLSQALVSDTKMIRSSQESEYIVAINSSGQHLLNLIGDVLDLSKLNAGARSLEKEPFTILELMEECRNTFLVACQDKGVSLNIDSQLEGAYPVLGDITVLKQILYNLLSNAVKFTQQGSITLTAEPYVAEEIDPNPNLGIMFTVADTGKGVSADAIGTLFHPFTQEDNGITRSFGGSGLGLNIAQKLAQLMGGGISCNSIVGQGSIFEVIVYLEQQPSSFEMFDHSDRFEMPPLKLLIVDDVPLNLMVAAALLKPKGHIIETAANGHKALEMASNNDYDAILMDVHMPGMDGMEATRRIRNCVNKQRAAVPIVALTADVDVRQKALFIASGMDTTVGKPWELKVLEKELKRLLKLG
jgi:signal transduction histidine kinase/CheY-like chemotaxis protein